MFYTEICRPRISDFTKKGRISLISLLGILEDVATHHSAWAGDDVLKNSLGGSAWICTNWRIRMIKPPAGDGELTVSTWAREKTTGATVLREYTICDKNGKELVLAEAKFVRLDIASGKPVRIEDELYDAYAPEERAVFEDRMERLTPPEVFDSERIVELRKSDLDFNDHVHNTRYLDIAAAGVPEGGVDLFRAQEINIAYRKAIRATDRVTVKYAAQEKGCFISICSENGNCCFITAEE